MRANCRTRRAYDCRMAYNQRIADYVCEQLALGRGLRTIARDQVEGMPNESTLREWATNDAVVGAQYARARLAGNESDFELLDEWADEKPPTLENGAIDNGWNAWNRTRIDTKKWSLGKRQPGRYGDRTVVAGDPDAPLIPADPFAGLSVDELRAAIAALKR